MTDQQPPGTHTDGPWKASDLPEGRCFEVETADGAFYIGSCPFGDPSVEPEVPSFSEARANARMFASAPALAAENARLIALVGEAFAAGQLDMQERAAVCADDLDAMIASKPEFVEPQMTNAGAWRRVRDGAQDIADAIRAIEIKDQP